MERGESLRSNVVHDDGDAKTMFAAENVLEESRLSRALSTVRERKAIEEREERRTRKPERSVTGSALGGMPGFFALLLLELFLTRFLAISTTVECVIGKSHREITVAGDEKVKKTRLNCSLAKYEMLLRCTSLC